MQQPNSEMQMRPRILKIVTASYNKSWQLATALALVGGFTIVKLSNCNQGPRGAYCARNSLFMCLRIGIMLNVLWSMGDACPLLHKPLL